MGFYPFFFFFDEGITPFSLSLNRSKDTVNNVDVIQHSKKHTLMSEDVWGVNN
jgi:hypothetical protein